MLLQELIKFTTGATVCTHESTDWSKSHNGGDYSYYETPISMNGKKVGVLHSSSADYTMCPISGRFCNTNDLISVFTPIGEILVYGQLGLEENQELSVGEFLELLNL